MTEQRYHLALATVALTAVLAVPGAARAKDKFIFTDLTPPNAGDFVYLTGVYQDQAIGYYKPEKQGSLVSFTWSAGNYTVFSQIPYFTAISSSGVAVGPAPFPSPNDVSYDLTSGAMNTIVFAPPPVIRPHAEFGFLIGGINSSAAFAAVQYIAINHKKTHKDNERPFEQLQDGSYRWLARKQMNNALQPIGLLDNNMVVMETGYPTFGAPYVIGKDGHKRTFTIPGSKYIKVLFVNGDSFGGSYEDASKKTVGFSSKGGSVTTYTGPAGSTYNQVTGAGPHGDFAGSFGDSSSNAHGFIYHDHKYYIIDVPHQPDTKITGFSSTGAIVGYFGTEDDISRPFIATCASDKVCIE